MKLTIFLISEINFIRRLENARNDFVFYCAIITVLLMCTTVILLLYFAVLLPLFYCAITTVFVLLLIFS